MIEYTKENIIGLIIKVDNVKYKIIKPKRITCNFDLLHIDNGRVYDNSYQFDYFINSIKNKSWLVTNPEILQNNNKINNNYPIY